MLQYPNIDFPCIGIDPDLHCITMADITSEECWLVSIKIPRSLKNLDTIPYFLDQVESLPVNLENTHVFIEGQEIKQAQGTRINKQNIVELANMAGAIMGALAMKGAIVHLVKPFDWKGTIKKQVHQRRICKAMGWGYNDHSGYVSPNFEGTRWPYTRPKVVEHKDGKSTIKDKMNQGDWKHALDSIGLSLYGAEQLAKGKV